MVKYYYDRYYTIITPGLYQDTAPWASAITQFIKFNGLYKSYSFDSVTNRYAGAGGTWSSGTVSLGSSGYSFNSDGTQVTKWTSVEPTTYFVNDRVQVSQSIKSTVENTQNPTTYSRGSLVQADIVAEYETYVTNRRNGDGYWYVRKGVANTAPTTPGAFTQPTGELEIGDARTLTWGGSSDAEGNLSQYVLEVAINNGAWTSLATVTSPSYSYTIPTATSVKFRVKARDAEGLESAYRESPVFTVTKPRYYWNKHNVADVRTYVDNSPYNGRILTAINFTGLYRNYTFDKTNNSYRVDPALKFKVGDTVGPGNLGYSVDGGRLMRYQIDAFSGALTGGAIAAYNDYKQNVLNTFTTSQAQGTLVQSGIVAVDGTYPDNGKHTDGFWYTRGSRVNQSIAPPGVFTAPAAGAVFKPGESVMFTHGAAPGTVSYELSYRFGNDSWTTNPLTTQLSHGITVTRDRTKPTLEVRVRARNSSNVWSDYIYSDVFTIQHNAAPVVNLGEPTNAQTLYENDAYVIDGSVVDTDVDDTVTVRYQVGAGIERAIKAYLSTGNAEAFSRQLTFRGGNLYEGETLVASGLVDGTEYRLRVWATDDKGSSSTPVERVFHVVPNRAPLLTVDTPTTEGSIDSDVIAFTGSYEDQDGNPVVVTYRVNAATSVEVANAVEGSFDFAVPFKSLVVGNNSVVVEATDSLGAKNRRTFNFTKRAVQTPLLQSTVRYRIEPPSGSASSILLWVQRDAALDIAVSVSTGMQNEAEVFREIAPDSSAPIDAVSNIIEDEFYVEGNQLSDNILVQIDMNRTSVDVNDRIHLISGVLE